MIYEAVADIHSQTINGAEDVFEYMNEAFQERPTQEAFYVLPLNSKNRILGRYMVTLGIVNVSLVHPREVFQPIILSSATAFVVCHNHPSGDPNPSRQDIQVTRELRKAGNIMKIEMLDHVVIGDKKTDPSCKGYYSFLENGLI